jgi:multiple sugar transport system substrate-binding protein
MSTYRILGPDDPALAALKSELAAHPEWQTDLVILPWADYQPALNAALQAEVSPYQAVCAPGHVWLPGLVSAGQLAAFDPLLPDISESLRQDYNAGEILPAVAREATVSGQTYLLPLFTDGHLLFFNKERLDLASGATISPLSLAQVAASARLPAGTHALALKAHPSEIFLDWLPFLWAAGGEVIDATGAPGFAGPEGVEALEYYCALRQYCPPQPESFGNAEIARALVEGQVALAASWGGQAAVIFDGHANLGTALYTHPWNATWGICLPANQPQPVQRAMLERLYATCGPHLDREVTRLAGSPVRQSSYSEQESSRYPWLPAQYEMLLRAGNLPGNPRLSAFLGDLYGAVFAAFSGQESPLQALKKAKEKALWALE